MTIGGGVRSTGPSEASVGASFETELSSLELMTHFGPQMLTQGWVSGAFEDLDGFTLQTFSLIDEHGSRWISLITIADPGEGKPRRARLGVRQIKAID